MANTYNGDFNYAYSLNVETAKPLDSRTVVSTIDELSTISYTYKGMIVSITGTDAVYILTAENGKDINNWKKVSGDESLIENISADVDTVSTNLNTLSADVDTVSSNLNTLSSNLIGISNAGIQLNGDAYDVHISGSDGIKISSDSTTHVHITDSGVEASDIIASNIKTDKFQIAKHAIFGDNYKNPDVSGYENIPISTELKGWYFTSRIEEVDTTNNIYRVALSESSDQTVAFTKTTELSTITVDSKRNASSKILSGLLKGDKISMKNYYSINNLLTVEQIDGNVLTYKFDKAKSPNGPTTNCATGKQYRSSLTAGNPARVKECCIWCIDKPSIGVADLSQYNAIVGGSGCEVYGVNGFASGELNKVIDDYGAAFGKSNTVGYCCFSAGQINNSTGCEYAATFGAYLTTTNNYQFLVGYNFTAEKDTVFAVKGRNANVPALHIRQNLVEFGAPVTINTSLAIGTSNKIRKNSLVIGNSSIVDGGSYNCSIGNTNKITHENVLVAGKHLTSGANHQTVVGLSNEINTDARFIVGGGAGDGTSKKNILTVTNNIVAINGTLKIGNTTITEEQLKKILALI